MRRWILAVGLAGAVLGCTSWVKPGATDDMRDAQIAFCKANSYRQAPSVPVTVLLDPGGFRAPERTCWRQRDGQPVCRVVPGYWEGPSYGTQDVNRPARDAYFQDCMFRAGWTEE